MAMVLTGLYRPARVFFFFLLSASSCWAQSVAVQETMAAPTIVNVYWAPNWDALSPGMTMNQIDNVTSTLVNSTYFSGLAEYGVGAVVMHPKSFLADPSCGPTTAPATLNFYGSSTSITAFVDCQSRLLESLPDGPPAGKTLYNVFLPPATTEFDVFITCIGLPPFGLIEGAYHQFAAGAGGRRTPFTAIFASPGCSPSFSALIANLAHEMVEAITDPFPSLNTVVGREIADLCGGLPPTPFLTGINGGGVAIPFYWSRGFTGCISGFSSTTAPVITGVTRSGPGSGTTLDVSGTGFGALPAIRDFSGNSSIAVQLPAETTLPYFSFTTLGPTTFGPPAFAAGASLLPDPVTLRYSSWATDLSGSRIRVEGFGSAPPTGFFVVAVCNPSSGQCSSASEPPFPSISSVCSNSVPRPGCVPVAPAPGGAILTITGGFFGSAPASVAFRGAGETTAGTVISSNITQIKVRTPSYPPGPATITVTTSLGSASAGPETAEVSFAGFSFCGPRVDSVSPNRAQGGQPFSLTLMGSCFTGATRVTFGIFGSVDVASGRMQVIDDMTIKVSSPLAGGIPLLATSFANCRPVHVRVESPDGPGTVTTSPAGPQDLFSLDTRACPDSIRPLERNLWLADICAVRPHVCQPVAALSKASLELPPSPLGPGQDIGKEAPVSRGGLALALGRVFAFREVSSIVFSDVEKGSAEEALFTRVQPYLPARWSRGEALEFQAGTPVERQEAAVLVARVLAASRKARLAGNSRSDTALAKLADDKQISPGFRAYVGVAVDAGVMAPDEKKSFRPRSYLNRGELALLLKNLNDRLRASK